MGCGPSSLALAELNRSLATGDPDLVLLDKLQASPWLLSTTTSVITSTIGTPLHMACDRKQLQAVQDMLSFLACSPLSVVREALQPYCRRMGQPLPASVEEGMHIAVDMINCKGQTPLMYACVAGSPDLVKLLMSQGADPWLGDHCGSRTALHYAALSGNVACIEALMENLRPQDMARRGGRYINVRTLCGLTALHYAAFFEHRAAVEELLRHDPQLNAVTNSHSEDVTTVCVSMSTPLHFAAHRGNLVIARQLLLHHFFASGSGGGARSLDPRMRINQGHQLPWQVAAAIHSTQRELIALLHPAQSLERALGLGPGITAGVSEAHALSARKGPQPLAVIAATALAAKLEGELRTIMQQHQHQQYQHQGPGDAEVQRAIRPQGFGATVDATCTASSDMTYVAGSIPGPVRPAALGAPVEHADDEGLCGVCLTGRKQVAPEGCSHGVCSPCAGELSRGVGRPGAGGRPRPLLCPFCRREVAAWRAVAAARHAPTCRKPRVAILGMEWKPAARRAFRAPSATAAAPAALASSR